MRRLCKPSASNFLLQYIVATMSDRTVRWYTILIKYPKNFQEFYLHHEVTKVLTEINMLDHIFKVSNFSDLELI